MRLPPIYELGPDFYDPVKPALFPKALLRYRNQNAAAEIGLDKLSEQQWEQYFCHFKAMDDNLNLPLALRYHGHQFQHYNPDLGDGRGFLFAQLTNQQGKLLDLGTKGSGQTPYSRQGDGRLTLKGAFREALATELLESLGVNTSKSFSIFETGESLDRNDEPSPTRSAVLVRLSHSHIRFGTFQRLAYLNQSDNIKKLMSYVNKNYFSIFSDSTDNQTASLFFEHIMKASARCAAEWMIAGFVHGVMNTDNMNITGESFDYGPYRFLPQYDPNFTAAYFDRQGLYSFGRQPISMLWNLEQLAKSLNVAWPNVNFNITLEKFSEVFNEQLQSLFLRRLNLLKPDENSMNSSELIAQTMSQYFRFLEKSGCAYEQLFFDLHSVSNRWKTSPQVDLYQTSDFSDLVKNLEKFKIERSDLMDHPYFKKEKCCSLIINELEAIWDPIAKNDDWKLFEKKLIEIRSFRGIY